MKGSTCHFFQQLSEPRAEEEEEGKLLTQALEFKLPEAWVGFDFWLLLAEAVSTVSPSTSHELMGPNAIILVF